MASEMLDTVTLVGVVSLLLTVITSPSSAIAERSSPRHPGQRELRYVIQEELLVGSDVADIADDAGLVARYGPEVARSSLRFRFLATPRVPVAVDERTGKVRTTGRLDRETICGEGGDQLEQCLDRLDVAVQPMNYFQIIKVRARRSHVLFHSVSASMSPIVPTPSAGSGTAWDGMPYRQTSSFCLKPYRHFLSDNTIPIADLLVGDC